jgi:Uncharacterised nucleotidyltransferase
MERASDFRLFCVALRRPLGSDDAAALRDAIAAGPDWDAILAGARRHRVAPLLLAGLQGCGSTRVPEHVLAELRRLTVAVARRSLAQAAEAARLARAFAEAGLRVLALKGVVLSAQLHGDGVPRDSRDIDLLADPDQFAAAEATLAAAGYRYVAEAKTPRQTAAYRHALKDLQFVHTATGAPVELHHRLNDNPNLLATDFDALWRERAEIRIGDAAVATLGRALLALYLMVHGAGHGWERLVWLTDFAAALRAPGAVERAIASAEAAGLATAMLHAVSLAHDWLAVPVGAQHLARAHADAKVARLDRLLAHLYAGGAWHEMPPRGSWAKFARASIWQRLYRLSLKANARYLASQLGREWFTPADWDSVRLPDGLFFLYPVVRPLGWLARRLR